MIHLFSLFLKNFSRWLWIIPLCLVSQPMQAQVPAHKLTLNQEQKLIWSPGQQIVFELMLSQPATMKVRVEQRGLDLSCSVIEPGGTEVFQVDTPTGLWGFEEGYWKANQVGIYKIVVKASLTSHTVPKECSIVVSECSSGEFASRSVLQAAFNTAKNTRTSEGFLEVATLARQQGDQRMEGFALKKAADALSRQGNFDQAEDLYQQAEVKLAATGERGGRLIAVSALAQQNEKRGRFRAASQGFERVRQFYLELGDHLHWAKRALDVSRNEYCLGNSVAIIPVIEEALVVLKTFHLREAEALMLSGLAVDYDAGGFFDAAETAHTKAASLLVESDPPETKLQVWCNQAAHYIFIGRWDDAFDLLRDKALPLAKSNQLTSQTATATYLIGWAWYRRGNLETASTFCRSALELLPQMNDLHLQAILYHNVATMLQKLGKHQEAIELLEHKAIPKLRELQSNRDLAAALNVAGRVEADRQNYKQASLYLAESRELLQSVSSPDWLSNTLYWQARIGILTNQLDQAEADLREAIRLTETLKQNTPGLAQIDYFATTQTMYDALIEILFRKHKASPAKGYDQEAFLWNERRLARGMVEKMATTELTQSEADSLPVEWKQLSEVKVEINRLAAQRAALLITDQPQASDLEKVERQLAPLLRTKDRLAATLTSPIKPAGLTNPDLTSLQKMVDASTALVEFHVGEFASYAWIMTEGGFRSVTLPSKAELQPLINELQASVPRSQANFKVASTPTSGLKPTLAKLSTQLLRPLALPPSISRLIMVRSDVLNWVPLAALPLPEKPVLPLLAQCEISYSPSATFASQLLQRQSKPTQEAGSILVMADPVFTLADSRLPQVARLSGTKSERVEIAEPSNTFRGLRFSRLPASSAEAALIERLCKGKVVKKLGFDASRSLLSEGKANQFQMIHIATHSVIREKDPSLSGLLFSLLDSQGKAQDGFLTLMDIAGLPLKTDLVVISACQTADGKLIEGEGPLSFSRAFLLAGARTVVGTQWAVDDKVTSELMKLFYEQLFTYHLPPTQALRKAQLHMLKNPAYQSPEHWAAFECYGDWR
ncbi:MAG: CHAT domain-containing protein [Acidobacteria bacterium]|nr:CHAT domain-containing protein [Acidobacteriota bacterium]